MYHMTFAENLNPRALVSASWGLPLYLLLMSLAVPLILWAGLKLGVRTNPEYFTLGLGLTAQNDALALIAFIGGLSASSGLIIVSTLALSGMALNHLVLPLYQPPSEGNIYRWLKWTRRSLIFAIIIAGYGFYLLLGAEQDLSNLGIVAFVATLQFLPGVLSVLYWQTSPTSWPRLRRGRSISRIRAMRCGWPRSVRGSIRSGRMIRRTSTTWSGFWSA